MNILKNNKFEEIVKARKELNEKINVEIDELKDALKEAAENPNSCSDEEVAMLEAVIDDLYNERDGKSPEVKVLTIGVIKDSETNEIVFMDEVEQSVNFFTYPSDELLTTIGFCNFKELMEKMNKESLYPDELYVSFVCNKKVEKCIKVSSFNKIFKLLF